MTRRDLLYVFGPLTAVLIIAMIVLSPGFVVLLGMALVSWFYLREGMNKR